MRSVNLLKIEFIEGNIPQMCGAINATHIKILTPFSESKLD